MTQHEESVTLNDLMEVLNDGRAFYEEAARDVHADLAAVFRRMAQTKAAIASDLSGQLVSRGDDAASGGTFSGTLRKLYAEVRTLFASDEDAAYIEQLEEFEDRILASFRKAVEETDDAGVREIAQRHLPQVTRDHNDMRAMKKTKQSHG